MRSLVLAGIVIAASASACGLLPGDESEIVHLHNTLDVPVNVYHGDRQKPGLRLTPKLVQPGETAQSQWLVVGKRDGKRRDAELPLHQVEATTTSGERVFCQRYSATALDELRWTIEIVRRDECR